MDFPGPVYVGIDVAKDKHVALVEEASGKRRSIVFGSSKAEFNRFIEGITSLSKSCEIALEPTGDYHRTLAYALIRAGHNVSFVSSMSTSRAREMFYNSWDKNDPKDAQVILSLLKSGNVQTFTDPLIHGHHDLQELANTYQSIVKRKTKIYHTILTHYLPLYFPEAERFITNGRASWFIDVLKHAPCPSAILAMTKLQYVKRVMVKGGKDSIRQKLIEEFYELAKNSTALPVKAESVSAAMFKMILEEHSQLNRRRKEIEEIIEERLQGGPDYNRLRRIPGIGPVLALLILAEAGNLRRFSNYKKFLKYCGLNLNAAQSGKSQSTPVMAKRGNARLRYAFWMAAGSAIRQRQNTFRVKYDRYVARDPSNADLKRKAFSAVAAKMARVVHALINSDSDYQHLYVK